MFKRSLILIGFLSLFITLPTVAQIPVTDAAAISKSTAEHIETIAKWKMQYDQMQQEFTSITGSRGLGEIFNNPNIRNALPTDWQTVFDKIGKVGFGGMTPEAQTIYNQNKLYDRCANITDNDQQQICQKDSMSSAQNLAFLQGIYKNTQSRLGQLDSLMKQINQTEDPKAISELQGRIAVEQAAIQNEMMKIKVFQMEAEQQKRLVQEQRRQLFSKEIHKTGTLNPTGHLFSND